MTIQKVEAGLPVGAQATAAGRQEVRCAVRFPLALPVVLSTGNGDIPALTRNVSASGVLFSLDRALPVGLDIRFSMRMPQATSWALRMTWWSTARDVWYAAPQATTSISPRPQLTNIDLRSSENSVGVGSGRLWKFWTINRGRKRGNSGKARHDSHDSCGFAGDLSRRHPQGLRS